MRLTLRTLLAYLDHTLDPADEAALGEKVRQSGFASELVHRIEGLLSHPQITAPSPDAVGPTDDPNAVAEYLDSTLVAEMTAEVERQCIDSDEQLAEVAACHQVLTIALGEPAVVPNTLRQRVYAQRPERGATAISDNEGAIAPALAAGPVTPVGPADSGVSDATTRLPQEVDLNATLAAATAALRKNRGRDNAAVSQLAPSRTAMAGDRSRETLEAMGPFLSGGRPSRVTPWLVSLGLAAAFLFVLTQAFEPFTRRQTSDLADQEMRAEDEALAVVASPTAPPAPPTETPSPASDLQQAPPVPRESVDDDAGDEDVATDSAPPLPTAPAGPAGDPSPVAAPGPANSPGPGGDEPRESSGTPNVPNDASDAPPLPSGVRETNPSVPPKPGTVPGTVPGAVPGTVSGAVPGGATDAASNQPVTGSDDDIPPVPGDAPPRPNSDVMEVTDGGPPSPVTPSPTTPSVGDTAATSDAPPVPSPRPSTDGGVTEVDPSSMLDAAAAAAGATAAIGRIENDGGLLLTQDRLSGVWGRLFTDSDIATGTVLVSSPTFRSLVTLDAGVEVTLIGPTGIRVDVRAPEGLPSLTVDFGRLLITTIHGPVNVLVATPAGSGVVRLSEAGATAAVSVDFHRASGTDPGVAASSKPVLSVLSVHSEVVWEPLGGGELASIGTGEQLQIVAGGDLEIDVPSTVPSWLDTPEESVSSIEATARSGLVEFLAKEQPIEMALREAVSFRREEVAALAAQTLLNLGLPDSYFGPSGVLNRPAQRTYWPELVTALRQFVNRGPHSAAIVARAVSELEGEATDEVLRLLQGFSTEQLETGGDATLVAMLDHPVMSVRVLATETLRKITGTSLYFRADYDTAARRSAGIKKWEAKLNRDQIRWADPAAP